MKKAAFLAMLPILLLPAITATASARGLDLVRHGQPRAEIVVDRNAHNGIQLPEFSGPGYDLRGALCGNPFC